MELSNLIKSRRNKIGWTQEQLVKTFGYNQSRIAKMEAGDAEISLDLMVKVLLQLGVSKQEIGKLFELSL